MLRPTPTCWCRRAGTRAGPGPWRAGAGGGGSGCADAGNTDGMGRRIWEAGAERSAGATGLGAAYA